MSVLRSFVSFVSSVLRCDVSNDGYVDKKEFSNWITVAVRLLFFSSFIVVLFEERFAYFF